MIDVCFGDSEAGELKFNLFKIQSDITSEDIENFKPMNEQEENDKRNIYYEIYWCARFGKRWCRKCSAECNGDWSRCFCAFYKESASVGVAAIDGKKH